LLHAIICCVVDFGVIPLSKKFGIVGGGVMGEAILSRLLEKKLYTPSEIVVSDPQAQRRNFLAEKYAIQVTAENAEVAQVTELLLLAIKPQVFAAIAAELAGVNVQADCIVSILAGISLKQLEAAFPTKALIRSMPNTPAQVGAGVTAIAAGQQVQAQQLDRAKRLLETVGSVVEVPESLLDAVTGLSGSGPGYVALVVEALADGGVASGLPRSIALELAIQTVLGTAQLLHPVYIRAS
jgi:pyrroline-5-carboxylate reductase